MIKERYIKLRKGNYFLRKAIYCLIFFSVLIFTSGSFAQVKHNESYSKNEIYGSYGAASAQEIASFFDNMLAFPISFFLLSAESHSPVGPVMIGYRHYVNKHISFGIMGSYTAYKTDYKYTLNDSVIGRTDDKFYTVMARGDINYINDNYFQIYSGLSVGLTNFKTNYADSTSSNGLSTNHLAYQINLVGVRVGKNIGAFIELGFGYNGIFNGGISYKF